MTGGIVNLLMDSGAVNVVVAVGIVHLCNTTLNKGTYLPTHARQASLKRAHRLPCLEACGLL